MVARQAVALGALFGPAAIVASVSIGAGETIVVVKTGSWAGYNLLWLVLASTLIKGVCVTYLLGRYSAVSGEMIGQRLVRLPGPRGWLLVGDHRFGVGGGRAAVGGHCQAQRRFDVLPAGAGRCAHRAWRCGFRHAADTAQQLFGISAGTLAFAARHAGDSGCARCRQRCFVCLAGTTASDHLRHSRAGHDRGNAVGSAGFRGGVHWHCPRGHVPPVPDWVPADVRQQPLLTMTTTFGYVGGSVMCYIAYANWVCKHRWGLCSHREIDAIRAVRGSGQPA